MIEENTRIHFSNRKKLKGKMVEEWPLPQHLAGKSLKAISDEDSVRRFGKVVDYRRTGRGPAFWEGQFKGALNSMRQSEMARLAVDIPKIKKALRTKTDDDISKAMNDNEYWDNQTSSYISKAAYRAKYKSVDVE